MLCSLNLQVTLTLNHTDMLDHRIYEKYLRNFFSLILTYRIRIVFLREEYASNLNFVCAGICVSYVHIYLYIHIYVYMYILIHMLIYTRVYMYILKYIYIHTQKITAEL